jgi:hypothetical protein
MSRLFLALLLPLLVTGGLSCCRKCENPVVPTQGGQVHALSVPLIPQQTQVWCWAATSEMVCRFFGRPVNQCEILSGWLQAPCCIPNPFCVQAAPNLQIIQHTLSGFCGIASELRNGPLTLQEIRAEIDAGRPMILAYQGSFAGHVVVLYGYSDNGFVLIHDPYYGTFTVPFTQTFVYGGQLGWVGTIWKIRTLALTADFPNPE